MDVEAYLSNFYSGTKNPSLKAMQYFMKEFGNPEKSLKVIHIAGTNGKGSCTEMMTNILSKAGYKVGKLISPHLIKYNERISIGNKNITNTEMEQLIEKIKPKVDQYNQQNSEKVTLFELEVTMAILYFYEKKCDFVVLETGLGGLYDCTNIVQPIVSMITSIGYDHMYILGNSLLEIAEQKAGIIKENSETIFVEQEEIVNRKIKQTCANKNNILHLIQKQDILNTSYDENFQKFDYKKDKNIVINLKGKKQIQNAVMCLECVKILRDKSYVISEEAVRRALKTVVHKGRFEKISENPTIIFDGAHNKNAIENFKNNVKMYHPNKHKVYIISILKTKDYATILKELLEDDKSVFIFTSGNDAEIYVAKEELLQEAKKYTNNQELHAEELENAIDLVKEKYQACTTFIVGSFYVYGNVIAKLKEK